jgi:hypothetical protein
VGIDPKPTVHELRHFRHECPAKQGLSAHCRRHFGARRQEEIPAEFLLTLSDDDLIKAIDMVKFDVGETEIRVKK